MNSFIVQTKDLLPALKQLKPYTNPKIDQMRDILAKVEGKKLYLFASDGKKIATNSINIESNSSYSFMIPIMWEQLLSNLPSQAVEITVDNSPIDKKICHHEVQMVTYKGTYKNKCQMNPDEFYGNSIISKLQTVSVGKENFINSKYIEKVFYSYQ